MREIDEFPFAAWSPLVTVANSEDFRREQAWQVMKIVTDSDSLPPSFLGRRLSASFTRRVVTIAPRRSRSYDACEWRDAIVAVDQGTVEVACSDGTVLRFGEGDLLYLAGQPVRALHNPGAGDAVLVCVRRRRRGLRKMSDIVVRLARRFRARSARPPK